MEKDGIGLLEFSTPELMGRKLFLWGQGQGGRNWNSWLAGAGIPCLGHGYIGPPVHVFIFLRGVLHGSLYIQNIGIVQQEEIHAVARGSGRRMRNLLGGG